MKIIRDLGFKHICQHPEFSVFYGKKIFVVEVNDSFNLSLRFFRLWYCDNKLEDFDEIMRLNRSGNTFEHFNQFAGVNITHHALAPFKKQRQKLTKHEKETFSPIINYIKSHKISKFDIIGVQRGDEDSFDHEISHTLYNNYQEYRNTSAKLYKALPILEKMYIKKELKNMGYKKEQFKDEIQAFFSCKKIKDWFPDLKEDVSAFRKLFISYRDKYFN